MKFQSGDIIGDNIVELSTRLIIQPFKDTYDLIPTSIDGYLFSYKMDHNYTHAEYSLLTSIFRNEL